MLPLEEGLRQFWLPGLHGVKGRTSEGLGQWLLNEDFLFTSVTSSTEFRIKTLDPDAALSSIAHDCSRMSCAAFETFFGISDARRLPRSCGWTNISTYYGAFFAAHSILRMCGKVCFQIESSQRQALEKVALLFGVLPPSGFEGGFYIGSYDNSSGELSLRKSSASSKGSHGVLWELFEETIRESSNTLISRSALYNTAALFLADLADSLCQSGLKGTWLSNIRNSINYRHEHGAWYPYKSLKSDRKDLIAIASKWQRHPQKLLISYPGNPLAQHVASSTAIVSTCYLMVADMSTYGGHRSFHTFGALALVKLAAQAA